MLRGMYSSVSAMINLQSSTTVIANNMANVNTAGFKSETLVSKAFDNMLLSNNDRYVGGQGKSQSIGVLNPGVRIDEVITNYQQGTLVETEGETDFAINGSGFFAVRDGEGNINYTRNGEFRVNSVGYLVTGSGDQVMGINQRTGSLEPIYVGNREITMDSNNNILLDSEITYKFNIVDFDDYSTLNKIGDNLYSGENARRVDNYEVKVGYIEGSNVDIIDATTALMSNLRAFEANQKVIQTMDSTLNKIANEIGRV